MELGNSLTTVETATSATISRDNVQEKDSSLSRIKTYILVNGSMGRNMVKVLMCISTLRLNSLGNGRMASSPVGSGFWLMVPTSKVPSSTINPLAMAIGS